MGIKNIINRSTALYTLYSIASLIFFVWILFPSEYFANFIEKSVEARGSDVTLTVQAVSPCFPAGIKLSGLTVSTPDFGEVQIDYIKAGIDLLSMVKFEPAISFSGEVFGGDINGILKIPERDVKKSTIDSIEVNGIDLSKCSTLFEKNLDGFDVSGVIDASGSYALAGRGHGKISLSVRDLKVQPEKPMLTLKNISFSEITAEAELKSKRIQIDKCEIDGNEFDGSVKGSVILKYPYDKSVLRLSGMFRPEKEFAEKMPLELVFKKKVKYGDEVPFKVSGTLKKPRLR